MDDHDNSGGRLVCVAMMEVDERDFSAVYDDSPKVWTVAWKWAGDSEPDALRNTVTEYAVAPSTQAEYELEVEEWMAEALR